MPYPPHPGLSPGNTQSGTRWNSLRNNLEIPKRTHNRPVHGPAHAVRRG
jgi:hypothetical protein